VESEHLRKENDLSGPQDELEYWKRRGAQFSQIVTHLQGHEVSKLLILYRHMYDLSYLKIIFSVILKHIHVFHSGGSEEECHLLGCYAMCLL
jgi:hypothetical protein